MRINQISIIFFFAYVIHFFFFWKRLREKHLTHILDTNNLTNEYKDYILFLP